MTFASATTLRARRRVRPPANSGRPSKKRSPQLPQLNLRLAHTSVVGRPDTSRSRILRLRVSCTRPQRNPHAGHLGCLTADSTPTTNPLGVSATTARTRT